MAVQANAQRRKKAKRAAGRPAGIEGEVLAIGGEMLRSAQKPDKGGVYFLPIDDIILRKGWRTYREMRHDEQVKAVLTFKKTLVAGRTWDIIPAQDIPKPDGFDDEVKAVKDRNAQREKNAQAAAATAALEANADPKDPKEKKKFAEPEPGEEKKPAFGGAKKPNADELGEDHEEIPKHDPSSPKAKEIARFIDFNLQRINFAKIVRDALTAFEFGFSAGEIVYEVGEFEGNRAILLKDIKHRDPQSMEIKADKHGNITGFKQTAIGEVIEVEKDKIWHWAHQSQFGNNYGVSDLRSAYRSWWAKRFIINFWNVFLERMGQPMTMMKYPQGASQDLKNTLKRILSSLASKQEILVPEGVEIELIEAQRTGKGDYDASLAFHDNAIAKAMLMIAILGLSSAEGGRTADSQSRLHLRVLFKAMDEISRDLMFSFHEQVIKPLVDMNFEHENLYPEFIWQDYGGFEGIEIADTIKDLHVAGIIDMDQADVNYIRSITGLPLRGPNDPPDEIQRPAAAPPPNSDIPPPAAQGNRDAKKGPGGKRKTDPTSGKKKDEI